MTTLRIPLPLVGAALAVWFTRKRPLPEVVDLSFGRELRRKRLAAGLTQEQFAKEVGVATKTITRIETGRCEPRPSTKTKLNDALGELRLLADIHRIAA